MRACRKEQGGREGEEWLSEDRLAHRAVRLKLSPEAEQHRESRALRRAGEEGVVVRPGGLRRAAASRGTAPDSNTACL
jgi:hypothetical protein